MLSQLDGPDYTEAWTDFLSNVRATCECFVTYSAEDVEGAERIEFWDAADVEIDGQPARVFDVTLSDDAAPPCERLPLFYGSKDEQLFRTDLLPGESVRFLVFDAPASSPVRTGMIGIHAAPGGDLDELAAVTADFIADLRFGD